VGYFFAKALYEKYQIPIGIINASVGGTPIEAWTSEEGLQAFPGKISLINSNKDTAYVNAQNRKAAAGRREFEKLREGDNGMAGEQRWYDLAYTPRDWRRINVPGYWEDQGMRNLDGVVWYRREIEIPSSMTGLPARLSLGRIVDADEAYVNGKRVGNTGYQYPQRRYPVPAGVLKPGKNILVVRVSNFGQKGGFVPDKPYYLATKGDTIDLKGDWYYKVGEVFKPRVGGNSGISAQNQPTALFNGMVAPFVGFPVRGFVWYQGESNTGNADEYEKLLTAMIEDWRKQWNQKNLPFLYAQLPNFNEVDYLPVESQWARLREAQRAALKVPNTAMVVTIDLGEWNDIHPGNKKPIGDRLALAAQRLAYNEDQVVHSGPTLDSVSVDGATMILQFRNTGAGLVAVDNQELKWLAIAGADKKFVWASSKIEGNKVMVWSDDIADPIYVRYAWSDNPEGANLFNKNGLPASPFEASAAQVKDLWFGKKAAVVLTYDDALDVHLDNAIPALDSLGLKATFYLSGAFPGCRNRLNDWRSVASRGHELGNHTFFHPCDASKPGRSWVSEDNDLSSYTTRDIVREIEMTDVLLQSIDGKKERTFAYTCGDTATGEGSFVNAIRSRFVAMRGVKGELNHANKLDLTNVNCYVVESGNEDQLIQWAEKAKQENALLVILFHGVGGGHSLNVDLTKHNNFLKYLAQNKKDIWTTTMLDAAKHYINQIDKVSK
jgi:sialate O-acetylesterase